MALKTVPLHETDNSLADSSHGRNRRAMAQKIEKLELESVSKKHWSLSGEVSARQREQNSLLERFVEFESNAKPIPEVTRESTESIEQIIRKRILDSIWDDPSRPTNSNPEFEKFKSNRQNPAEVSTEKSTISLSKMYEQEYKGDSSNDKKGLSSSISPELASLWDQVSCALDSLSHFQFASSSDFNLVKSASISEKVPSFSNAQMEKGVAIHAASFSNSQALSQL